jgi:hypothetical protein
MNYARFIYASVFLFMSSISLNAQFRSNTTSVNEYVLNSNSTRPRPDTWLASQAQSTFQIPVLSHKAAVPFSQMNSYWLTRMTRQSLNDGKLGTDYFWDHQGNLRESRFFVEVGGKRKPGLKLVFPRR